MSSASISAVSDGAGVPNFLAGVSGTPAGARENQTTRVNPWVLWVQMGRFPRETA